MTEQEEKDLRDWMVSNHEEYLKAAARDIKNFCEFHSDQSRRCLDCCFWNDSEGCSIYNWPEYWEV